MVDARAGLALAPLLAMAVGLLAGLLGLGGGWNLPKGLVIASDTIDTE